VAWLGEVVVIIVAELGVGRVAARTPQRRLLRRRALLPCRLPLLGRRCGRRRRPLRLLLRRRARGGRRGRRVGGDDRVQEHGQRRRVPVVHALQMVHGCPAQQFLDHGDDGWRNLKRNNCSKGFVNQKRDYWLFLGDGEGGVAWLIVSNDEGWSVVLRRGWCGVYKEDGTERRTRSCHDRIGLD
jgi:hypothetical protein